MNTRIHSSLILVTCSKRQSKMYMEFQFRSLCTFLSSSTERRTQLVTSNLSAFRTSLFNWVTLEYLIEYKRNPKNNMLKFVFAQSVSDRHQTYPLTDLCGDDSIKLFNHVIYYCEIGTAALCKKLLKRTKL